MTVNSLTKTALIITTCLGLSACSILDRGRADREAQEALDK